MLHETIDDIFDLYSKEVENLCMLLLGGNEMAVIIMVESFSEIKEFGYQFNIEENAKSCWMILAKQKCLRYINRKQSGGVV